MLHVCILLTYQNDAATLGLPQKISIDLINNTSSKQVQAKLFQDIFSRHRCFFSQTYVWSSLFGSCEVKELQAKGVKSLRVRGGPVGWMFFTVSPG